jgi:hypothetical protein
MLSHFQLVTEFNTGSAVSTYVETLEDYRSRALCDTELVVSKVGYEPRFLESSGLYENEESADLKKISNPND